MRRTADRCHRPPVSQAAITPAPAPDPTASTATVLAAARPPAPRAVPDTEPSRRSRTSRRARAAGSAGPAAAQVPSRSAKIPARPGLAQVPPSSGVAGPANAAAVMPVSPQARPATVAARPRTVVRRLQRVPALVPSSASPSPVTAMTRPLALAASAPGTSLSPWLTRPPGAQRAPASDVAASGEKVRSWLGRKPTTTAPAPAAASTRPPLLATPAGVASRHAAADAGRTKTCQKFSSCARAPPIGTTAQLVPPGSTRDRASGRAACAAAGRAAPAAPAGDVPHPAIMISAAARTPPAARPRRGLMTPS